MSVRAMKAGALEFLTRPLDTEVLLNGDGASKERDAEDESEPLA